MPIGNWNPTQTLKELQDDPWRIIRGVGTGGLSELPNIGGPLGDFFADIANKLNAATSETPRPDTSQDDADIAAAKALYGSSVDDFVNTGPVKYNAGGELNLDQIGALDQLSPSEMSNTSIDPRYKDAELAALMDLEDQSKNGFTARDQADIAKVQSKVNAAQRGRLGAIQQNMQNRGISGSGLDIMAQQQSAQDSSEREALAALEKNAQMLERKQNATSRLGSLAGQLSSSDFQQQAAKAQAQDAINRFNTQNSVQRTLSNNDIVNKSKQSNWQRTNQTSDNNSLAQGQFNTQKMTARQGQAEFGYNTAADSKNAKLSDWQQKEEARRRKLDAIGGLVGAGMGGYLGGTEGAGMGQSVGQRLGLFYAEGGEVNDDYRNDKIPVMASEGEVIVPKSLAEEGIEKQSAFVEKSKAETAIKGLLDAMNYLMKGNK